MGGFIPPLNRCSTMDEQDFCGKCEKIGTISQRNTAPADVGCEINDRVDWALLTPNFFFISLLQDAPRFYLAACSFEPDNNSYALLNMVENHGVILFTYTPSTVLHLSMSACCTCSSAFMYTSAIFPTAYLLSR